MLKESTFLEKLKHQREIKMFQTQISEKNLIIQEKEARIFELERIIDQPRLSREGYKQLSEMEVQCQNFNEKIQDQAEMIADLREFLKKRDCEMAELNAKIQLMENAAKSRQRSRQKLEQDMRSLRFQELKNKAALIEKEQKINACEIQINAKTVRISRLQQKKSSLKQMIREKQRIIQILQKQRQQLSNEKVKNEQKLTLLSFQNNRIITQNNIMNTQLQNVKNILSNNDWKQFCLQTQLDLAKKQINEKNCISEKNENRFMEVVEILKQKQHRCSELQRYKQQFQIQVRSLRIDMDKKQHKIQSLMNDIEQFKQKQEVAKEENCRQKIKIQILNKTVKNYEQQIQGMTMQIQRLAFLTKQRQRCCKMIEDELKQQKDQTKHQTLKVQEKQYQIEQLSRYLNAKLQQLNICMNKQQEYNQQLIQVRKQLERLETESYELEQKIEERDNIIEMHSEKIQQSTKALDFIQKKWQDEHIMTILRRKETQQKFINMQYLLKDRQNKINQLSVEVIQKQIELTKKIQEDENKNNELKKTKNNLKNAIALNFDLENKICQQQINLEEKTKQLEKACLKIDSLEMNFKQKQKIIQILQNDLKTEKNERLKLRVAYQEERTNHEQIQKILSAKQMEIVKLKQEIADNIENQLNYQFQIEELKKKIEDLTTNNELINKQQKQYSSTNERLSRQLNELYKISQERIQQISNYLDTKVDDTVQFEVLEDDNTELFEVIQTDAERQREQIKKKVNSYRSQILTFSDKWNL